MKKFISVILSIAIMMSIVAVGVSAEDDGVMSFAVASDLHYVEPTEEIEENIDDPIFYYANRRAQMEHESGFIIDEFLRQCAEDENCEFVLIPGDLANDGKVVFEQHYDVAEKLRKFEEETGKPVYVIDGNHDVSITETDFTTEMFKEVYYEFGYDEALVVSEDNCSYTADIGKNYRLIAADSCDPSKSTEDGLTTDRLSWIVEQAKQTKKDGKYPILMMHHNLLDHLPAQRLISRNFIVRFHYSTAEILADSGIKLVFTGHEHCSDAATYTSLLGNVIYDFATTSLTMYPLEYRMMHITDEEIRYENKKITQIDTKAMQEAVPDLTDEHYALMDEDFEAYAKEFFHQGIKYRLGRDLYFDNMGIGEDEIYYNVVKAAVTGLTDILDMPFYGENSVQELAAEYGLEIPESDYETPWHLVTSLLGMHYAGSEYYDLESTEVTMLLRTLVLILRDDFAGIFDSLYLINLANQALATLGMDTISKELTQLGIEAFGAVNAIEYAILGLISPLLYKFAYDNDGVDDNNGILPGYGTVNTGDNINNITDKYTNLVEKITFYVSMILKYALKGIM
ncbi:MAG: metallophosphoesterase [Acutalibacteraceae bacterium]|nr:metallophosphoesterase [Acutalibacteraceae bacterium]